MAVTPTAKLPLLARKDIRDNFDSSIGKFTDQVKTYLGEQYELKVDFPLLHAYAVAADSSSKDSPGSLARDYFESFTEGLKKWTEEGKYEPAVKAFNDVITSRQIVIAADEDCYYSACSVKNGTWEINFNPKSFGSNVSYAHSEFAKAFDAGLAVNDPKALPIIAQRSIRDDWESTRAKTSKRAAEELNGFEVKLTADYQAIWDALVDGHVKDKDVDLQSASRNFGSYLASYFDGFVSQLNYKFKKDSLMTEGFEEAVTSGDVCFQVVPEIKSSYNECEFADGKLLILTTPKYFGTNTSYATEKMAELL